jgi:hypothetical protein
MYRSNPIKFISMKFYINKIVKISGCAILVAIAALIGHSCKADLDLEPISDFYSEDYFTSVASVDQAVLGVYSALAADALYANRLMEYYVDTDEGRISGAYGGDNGRVDLGRYNTTPSNTELSPVYTALYNGIARANFCIERIPKMDLYKSGTSAQIATLNCSMAELVFMRAIFYHELIKYWGDVPYTTHYQELTESLNLPRVSRDTIYDHCISDMLNYVKYLPSTKNAGINERITWNAGLGILARICLHAAGYSLRWGLVTNDASTLQMARRSDEARIAELYIIADLATKAVIDYGENYLNPSYEQVFKNYQQDNFDLEESMFEIGFYYVAGTGGGAKVGVNNSISIANNDFYKNAGTYYLCLPTFYLSYDDADTRKPLAGSVDKIVANNDSMTAQTLWGMTVGKFRRDWVTTQQLSNSVGNCNWPMLRYSDVLLMFAEAENEIHHGPTQDAIDALNTVRLRAFNNDSSKMKSPSTYEGFFEAIVDERGWELCHEGLRKGDLIRWNLLSKKIQETKENIVKLYRMEDEYASEPDVKYYLWNPETKKLVISSSSFSMTFNGKARTSTSFSWAASVVAEQFAYGFAANKTELMPLYITYPQTNKNLKQHPAY